MMTHKSIPLFISGVGLVLASALVALAYPGADHNPFPADARPEQIQLHEFPRVQSVPDTAMEDYIFSTRDVVDGQDVAFRFAFDGDSSYVFDLTIDGRNVMSNVPFADLAYPGFWVYHADLNQDGKADYILQHWPNYMGASASGFNTITYLLSTENGWKPTTIATMYPEPANYVRLGGVPCFIHTARLVEDKCKDGYSHPFFVFNVLAFRGSDIRVDNSLHPGFPWIQKDDWDMQDDTKAFEWKDPIGGPTTLLTNEQRRQVHLAVLLGIFWRDESRYPDLRNRSCPL